eukprot:64659-Rhodomonas_salina.2
MASDHGYDRSMSIATFWNKAPGSRPESRNMTRAQTQSSTWPCRLSRPSSLTCRTLALSCRPLDCHPASQIQRTRRENEERKGGKQPKLNIEGTQQTFNDGTRP